MAGRCSPRRVPAWTGTFKLMNALTPQNPVAEEILQIARENDIPLRNDSALAEALATLSVGERVPPELFHAVAEVLAFVCRVNGK